MTREDYELWKNMPQTQEIMGKINEAITRHAENLANGFTLRTESAEATAIETAKAVGTIQGMGEIFSEDFVDQESED